MPRQEKKKRKTNSSFVPDDLLLNCFARVSRLLYPTLSLVSKRFGSLLTSPDLYKIRSSFGRTEICLYVCFQIPRYRNPCWFTLCRKPLSSGYVLVPISSDSPPAQTSELVAFGSKIYGIGGEGGSTCVLDCWTHKWHEGPSMRMDWSISTASLLDGKIYVAGSSKDCNNSLDWVQVFDLESQTWGSVTNPGTQKRHGHRMKSLGVQGKFYLFGIDVNVVYCPKQGEWNPIDFSKIFMGSAAFKSYCVIENVLFFWYAPAGWISWYNFNQSLWVIVKGLEDLPDLRHCGFCKLVDYGGKMVIFWNELVNADHGSQENRIWCAEISLERRNGAYSEEIWGKVDWLDVVLTLPESSLLSNAHAFSVTV